MTFVDTRELPDGHEIEADLCIIGAGAAGLALAHAFRFGPARVVLLESGGLRATKWARELNRGEIVGQPDYPLSTTRLRFFGGTTNHWTAYVRPLEAIDFPPRAWVPHS
ncbi:MAG: GMC family oxidoreductase, partial [Proteobacteria bacterium]|nr:GMC family oxidoreductase [Pseudomonadota bacterium]